MSVVTLDRPASRFLGLPWTGPYTAIGEVQALWRTVAARRHELGGADGASHFVRACHARRSECTVWVGIEPLGQMPPPLGMHEFLLMPQRYAVFHHRGPMHTVTQTYSRAFAKLRENGLCRDLGTLWLEIYDDRYLPFRDDEARATNEFDLLLAIEA